MAGVAHLNHKLRGEASEEDERFVAGLAARHGVPFYREEAAAGIAGGNLEQNARRERLKFFSRLIGEGKANRIATGHTRDDQAETVLFRLLRGSGLTGLAGILPVTREGLIRPLLDVSRAEVEEFLRARGTAWREDCSNHDRRFARNRIRHDLLPRLAREWNPEIAGRWRIWRIWPARRSGGGRPRSGPWRTSCFPGLRAASKLGRKRWLVRPMG